MAQDGTTAGGASYTLDNVTFPVGRTKLQSIFDAIRSTNIGNDAPDLVAGQFWIDNNTPSTTVWTLYFYDGTDSIQFATIDTINNTVNFIDSTFDLINDETPSLGGDLDLNSNDITGTGNINITGTVTSDKFTITEGEIEGSSNNFQIQSLVSGIIYDASNGFHTFKDNGTNRFQIRSGGDIYLGYEDTGTNPRIVYDASTEFVVNEDSADFDFRVESNSDTHALFVEGSSGNVTFGTNTATNISNGQNAGIGLVALNYLAIARDGGNTAYFNRLTSDGDIVVFRKDGSTVGSIGTDGGKLTVLSNGGYLIVGDGDTGLNYRNDIDAIFPWNTTTDLIRDNAIDLGRNVGRFKDLYLSGTVTNDGSGGMTIDATGSVRFNDSGIDCNFTIESNNNANMLRIDGGQDAVYVGGQYEYGTFTVTQKTNTSAGGIGVVDSGNTRSGRLWSDGSNVYLSSGSTGTAPLILNEGGGNVGIGTNSPSADGLHIVNSSQPDLFLGTTTNNVGFKIVYNDTDTVIGNETNTPLRFISNGGERVRIESGETVVNESSIDHDFRVESNNNTHMLFVDGGNDLVMFGKSSAGSGNVGVQIENNGRLGVTVDGAYTSFFNRKTSDGEIVQFRKDGTTVGSIFSSGSVQCGIGDGSTAFLFADNISAILPWQTNNTSRDAGIDLGRTTTRWKDLYLSGSVYLGGTGSANALDDYEEGDWTIELGGSTTDPTCTYNNQSGKYTKIGRMVHIAGTIRLASISGGTGVPIIKTLPFATGLIGSYTNRVFNVKINASGTTYQNITAVKTDSNNYAVLQENDGSTTNLSFADFDGNEYLTIWGVYETSS